MPLPKDIQDRRRRACVSYGQFWEVFSPELIAYRDNGIYTYVGKVNDEGVGIPAQIRTCNPMDFNDPFAMTKMEVKIRNQGRSNTITIGVCDINYPKTEFLPGWKAEKGMAIGVDASEGMIYINTDQGEARYEVCSSGDTMKCVVLPSSENGKAVIEFFRNDRKVTQLTTTIPLSGFYGVIGLASTGEEIILGPPEREEINQLDSHFEIQSEYIHHEGDGVYAYVPPKSPPNYYSSSSDMCIGTLRSHDRIDSQTSPSVLQVQLLDGGEDSAIAIGVCCHDYPTTSMPGWEEDSIAYHADISSILNGSAQKDLVVAWSVSETMQCIIEPIDGSTKEVRVVFRKKGDIIGKTKMWTPSGGLYWCVGLMSKGEKIKIILPRKIIPLEVPKSRFEDIWLIHTPSVEHLKDGICVCSSGGEMSDVAIIRSREPIDPLSPYPFYEVKIINPGQKNQIALGVCEKAYPITAMPGWSGRSIGFHCDTGNMYQSSVFPESTDHPCIQGDVIRCVVEAVDGSPKRVKVSFLKNGVLAKTVIDWTPQGGFYAQIGMMNGDERIQLACPLMSPSVLRRGIEGFDKSLISTIKERNVVHTSPIQKVSANSKAPPKHSVSFHSRYSYQPPVTMKHDSISEPQSLPVHVLSLDTTDTDGGRNNSNNSPLNQGLSTPVNPIESTSVPPRGSSTKDKTIVNEQFMPEISRISRSENPLFCSLHNVDLIDNNEIRSRSDDHLGYIMCRKQVSERLYYFEVDILSIGPKGISVGFSDGIVPAEQVLGFFPNSVSILTRSGILCNGSSVDIDLAVKEGDTIGCCANFLPIARSQENKNMYLPSLIDVCFYKNATLIGSTKFSLPYAGLYPTICLLESLCSVRVHFRYGLSPESYFETHGIPEGYFNFPMPDTAPTYNWKCLQNCEVSLDGSVTVISISDEVRKSEKPSFIQHYLPFSFNDCYFEVQLCNPATSNTILCIGAMPRLSNNFDNVSIPGEVDNSVGFMPLAGLVMRSREIAAYVLDSVVQQCIDSREGLKIGIGIQRSTNSSTVDSVLFFFTVSNQEVAHVVCPVPPFGLYPTVALLPRPQQAITTSDKACKLFFPKMWPDCNTTNAPWGIARISPSFYMFGSTFVIDNAEIDSTCGLQGCYPLTPDRSYFEAVAINGGSNYNISVGLATPLYTLNHHVGLVPPSIAYHVNSGSLAHDSLCRKVSPIYNHKGVRIGCGAVFPMDGSRGSAEIFFTVNGVLITQQHVAVPPSGFYPSIAMSTCGGMLELHLTHSNPFPDLKFATVWHLLDNILSTDSSLQLISHAHIGMAQLNKIAVHGKTTYFKLKCPNPIKSGRVLIGFSNCSDSPFSPKVSGTSQSIFLEISSGTLIVIQSGLRKSDDCCLDSTATEFGCGVKSLPNSHSAVVFFTADNQLVYATATTPLNTELRPSVCMVGAKVKLHIDACEQWPTLTTIGFGWGRFHNIKHTEGGCIMQDTQIHSKISSKSDIGFAQGDSPLLPSQYYFEVEIMSRDPKKAIAVGLASKRYDMSNWLGWKQEAIAYHTDDGRLYKASGLGLNFGPKLFKGDVIGCGLKFTTEDHALATDGNIRVPVFFTVNGYIIGTAQQMTIPAGGLFPTVCLESPSESVSVFFNCQYPSSLNRMSCNWARAYCVSQAGHLLEHQFKTNVSLGMSKVPAAFCQSVNSLSAQKNYFELQVVDCQENSRLAVGLAPLQPVHNTSITTSSVMFNFSGTVTVTLQSSSHPTVTSTRQKCEMGDIIGCKLQVVESGDEPSHIVFTRNGLKVITLQIPEYFANEALHPTIVLASPNDSVVPMLNASPPKYSHREHIGWLRSERVKLKGSVVEYSGLSKTSQPVGVAQISKPLCRLTPYYEIEVLDLGESSCLSIGAAALDHPLTHQPGWVSGSIGYHGDDGCMFNASGMGCSYGPSWKCGDVIGLGVRPYEDDVIPGSEVQVFFTKNGYELGHTTVEVPPSGFFPTVGLHSKGEKLKVNLDVKQSNTCDKIKMRWRTLIGVQLQYSCAKEVDILHFFDCDRRTPSAVQGLTPGLGIAIGHEPFSSKLQYFEVQILKFGEHKAVAIGVACKNYSAESVPGWRSDSVAYHTDTGYLHHSSGQGKKFGPVSHVGDKIGCGFIADPSSSKHCIIFFTQNGTTIGHHLQIAVPISGFYPVVGLVCPQDSVAVRFQETYKQPPSESVVGLMRIHNCSYSDHILEYNGGTQSGPANAHFAVSLNSSRNYFAASIIETNDNIRIGLVSKTYPLQHAPGSSSFSVAYDITLGAIKGVFGSDVRGLSAPTCEAGDLVGCGITPLNCDSGKSTKYYVFFTLNGNVVEKLQLPQMTTDLFPVVGFLPQREKSSVYMDWSMPMFEPQNLL